MLKKQQRKLKRLATLVTILSKYGFKDVIYRMNLIPTNDSNTTDDAVYVRIRKVLEELGPTFVKLGQAFSNREDLLPKQLILELQKLQDNVQLTPIDLEAVLIDNFGENYHELFSEVNKEPIASASIAQVYKATLKDGSKVVLKIKRPNIDNVIKDDLLILKDLIKVLVDYFEFASQLNLEQAINTFEKSLLSELSMVNERENIERLAINFKEEELTYVPKVYSYLSNNEMLCMEFIDGAKVTDSSFHLKYSLNPNNLADTGLYLYLTQILEHGFFHADPHAGNIMVLPDGKIVFIDLGAMGIIYPAERELLEDLILNLIIKNTSKLISILRKMAIRIEIKDEKKLEEDITQILDMVSSSSLENISTEILVSKFKDILFENRIVMPDYFTLLIRGLVLIESVGRTLNPEMNLISSIEPYIFKIVKNRLTPNYLLKKGVSKIGRLTEDAYNIPIELRNVLLQLNEGKLTINNDIKQLKETNNLINRSVKSIVISIVLASNIVATAIVIGFDNGYKIFQIPILGFLGIIFSLFLALILLFRILKKE